MSRRTYWGESPFWRLIPPPLCVLSQGSSCADEGRGTLTLLNDGQLLGISGSGTGTFTFYDTAGHSVLVLKAALKDGNHYYLEMMQMK